MCTFRFLCEFHVNVRYKRSTVGRTCDPDKEIKIIKQVIQIVCFLGVGKYVIVSLQYLAQSGLATGHHLHVGGWSTGRYLEQRTTPPSAD